MTRGIALLALLTLGAGAKHILGYAAHKRTRREQREAVHTWEAEGGAVPVGRSQTTASQVQPADLAAHASAQDGRPDPLRG
ncbi:MAG TPA: hypothetical protein VJM14_00305 [Burkholderiales bacterium]|jgi:hypothetical protein|nr:hypothetical protein [Burkholderiales bacterium]